MRPLTQLQQQYAATIAPFVVECEMDQVLAEISTMSDVDLERALSICGTIPCLIEHLDRRPL